MNDPIKKNLNLIRDIESKQTLTEAAVAAPVAGAATKGLSRFIPGVGAVAGAYDAYDRYKKGDYIGAALSGLGGAASLVPGIGTAASMGIAGAQLGRDYAAKTGAFAPDSEEPAQAAQAAPAQAAAPAAQPAAVPKGTDPKVLALQKQLIAKGAKIKADGVMGPQTQAAMKQFPDVAVAETKLKENKMSEAERIAALRARLDQINQPTNEGAADLVKGAWNLGKAGVGKTASAVKNFAKGVSSPNVTPLPNTGAAKNVVYKGPSTAFKAGQAVGRNPGKTAAGVAATGAGAGYMATKPAAAPAAPAAAATSGQPPKPTGSRPTGSRPTATPSSTGALDRKELDELDAIARELSRSNDPTALELMGQYNALRAKLGAATPVPGEMEE